MTPSLTAAFPDVSRETLARLEHYIALLHRWNPAINLVSPSTLSEVVQRHIIDSAQVYALAGTGWDRWADLGSGGGFPGMVVAILSQGSDGDKTVTLVESDRRKATFLRTVARETGTRADVVAERIEAASPLSADIVSARALAPLTKLLGYALPHLGQDGVLLFHKGAEWKKEVEEARSQWRFSLESHRSQTNSEAVVLEIRDLSHV